jgi:Tfp pilus assembly protein FimT
VRGSQALTLLEIILVVAVVGIVLAVGAVSLTALGDPLGAAASSVEGTFKQVRAKAMSTTSAYRVSRVSATGLLAEYAMSCSDTTGWTHDARLDATLDNGVQLTVPAANGVIVCFDARGLADSNPTVTLTDAKGATASVEVFVGGAVEVHR